MHKLANELIEKKNGEVIDNYDYENQKKVNPHGCVCYEQDKKCPEVENLNCFLY